MPGIRAVRDKHPILRLRCLRRIDVPHPAFDIATSNRDDNLLLEQVDSAEQTAEVIRASVGAPGNSGVGLRQSQRNASKRRHKMDL